MAEKEIGAVAGERALAPDVPVIKIVRKGELQAIHSRFPVAHQPPFVMESFGAGDAIIFSVHRRPMARAELTCDGKRVAAPKFERGNLSAFDLRRAWSGVLYPTFDTVNFHIARDAVERAGEEIGGKRVALSMPAIDAARIDLAMLSLGEALLPAFRRPGELMALFADQIVSAATTHIAATYADAHAPMRQRGGLASWQRKRAEDMLIAGIDSDIRLADLARACNLSVSQFTAAFKRTTGVPPYQWLLQQRVRHAETLLAGGSRPLKEIALACGFADQSHLTRVFKKIAGESPGAWRRMKRS